VKRIFLFCFILSCSLITTNAQLPDTVNIISVDSNFIHCLKLISPEFELTDDYTFNRNTIYKHYLHYKTKAHKVRQKKLHEDSTIVSKINFIKELATEKYLSKLMDDHIYQNSNIKNREVKAYYTSHIGLYTEYGKISYIQVFLIDTSTELVSEVKKILSDFILSGKSGQELQKKEAAAYTMNYEKEHLNSPSHSFHQAFNKAELNTIFGPFNLGTGQAMLVVTEKEPAKVIPYKTAKEKVKRDIHQLNIEKQTKELKDYADNYFSLSYHQIYVDYHNKTTVEQPVFGQIGKVPIDEWFIQAVQLLNPGFFFTTDSGAFTNHLYTYYIFPKAKARKARELGLDEEQQTVKNLDFIQSLSEDYFLSSFWDQAIESEVEIKQEEISEYYEKHKERFKEPDIYSFLWALINDDSKSTVEAAKKELKILLRDNENLEDLKVTREAFTIIYEKNYHFKNGDQLEQVLRQVALGKTEGLFNIENYTKPVLICVTEKNQGSYPSFEQVKDICLMELKQLRLKQMEKKLKQDVLANYLFVFY